MLFAHVAPGYCTVEISKKNWNPVWGISRRRLLWIAAIGSTIAPDADVIYNALFRGYVNHGTLYTHSLFVHGSIALVLAILYLSGHWHYLRTLIGLIAISGLSHLLLDVIAHDTPLFYPLSAQMIGIAPRSITEGGILEYVTNPLFLLEPLLLMPVAVHWISRREWSGRTRQRIIAGIVGIWAGFTFAFLMVV